MILESAALCYQLIVIIYIIVTKELPCYRDLTISSMLCCLQAAGKYKQEGKTYVVQDGDIIFFKFNVSGGGKK